MKWLKMIKAEKYYNLEWLSQSPDPNPKGMLRQKLRCGVHARKHTNITEFCAEEQTSVYPNQCAGVINSHGNSLVKVPDAQRAVPESGGPHTIANKDTDMYLEKGT